MASNDGSCCSTTSGGPTFGIRATSRTHDFGLGVMCPLGYFPCGNITKCLPQLFHCNGVNDCENQADEEDCGDNNGWSQKLDEFYNKRLPQHASEMETDKCLIESVPPRCVCHGLKLYCEDANLHTVPSVSSNVIMMYLQNNNISIVSEEAFRGLSNLTKLYLSHNKITSLKPHVFEDLHKLEWLSGEYMSIITSLTIVFFFFFFSRDLMSNSLSQLPDKHFCEHMPKLNWLDLEGNHIHSLRNATFISCRSLTVLDLANNKIESLSTQLFKDLKELSQLNISYNPIQKIQADQFDYLSTKAQSSKGYISIHLKHCEMPSSFFILRYFKKFQYCGYAPHVRSCKPNTDGISSFENLLASVIQRVFVWVVSAVTCFGNIFVICMRPYIRSENKLHALSIMSLCCADCLMGIYLFVIGAFDLKYRGEYNKHAQIWMDSIHCQLVGSLAILSTEVSVLLLTYLTLEKYICIVYPFRFLKPGKHRTISILVIIWILGFIVAFIPLINKDFFQNYYGTNGVCFPLHSEQAESSGAQIYSVIIFLGVNLVAFVIIVFSYGSMFYSVRQTAISALEIRNHVNKEMTLAKRFFFIVFTDALCWIPIFVLKLLSLLQVEIPGSITSWVVIFILPINSALNPLLYTLTTRPFKEMINQIWHNYKQRRSSGSKKSQKMYGPSFIWVEMWPTEDTSPEPVTYRDSSEGLINIHSASQSVYT
uniref:Relaxin family peptide receptor 1 n=1 Tax=Salvator merianae TaxID=96440 RepID=A0A8D0B9F1_SALMN